MSLKERLSGMARIGVAMTAIGLGGQGLATERPMPVPSAAGVEQRVGERDYSSLIRAENPEDKAQLQQFVGMMAETKTGSALLNFLQQNNTKIAFSDPAHADAGASYRADSNTINLRRMLTNNPMSMLWVMSHESEHARHTRLAAQNGYDRVGTLDDRYTLDVMKEGLAERSGCAVVLEYMDKHPEARQKLGTGEKRMAPLSAENPEDRVALLGHMIQDLSAARQAGQSVNDIANGVFNRRMSLKETPDWDPSWRRYENNTGPRNPTIPPKTRAEWNQAVSVMSLGQIAEMKEMPVVSFNFVKRCLSSELDRVPNARSVKDLDMSCAEKNREQIAVNGDDVRTTVISTLMNLQQTDEGSRATMPPALQKNIDAYLGVELSSGLRETMSWSVNPESNPEYRDKMNQARTNLQHLSPQECLGRAVSILNTPEAKGFLAGKDQTASEVKDAKMLGMMQEFFYPKQNGNILGLALRHQLAGR